MALSVLLLILFTSTEAKIKCADDAEDSDEPYILVRNNDACFRENLAVGENVTVVLGGLGKENIMTGLSDDDSTITDRMRVIPWRVVGKDGKNYYDYPSFDESRSLAATFVAKYFLKLVFDAVPGAKILLVVPYSYFRKQQDKVAWLVKKTSELMGDLGKYDGGFGVIVESGEEEVSDVDMDEVVDRLQYLLPEGMFSKDEQDRYERIGSFGKSSGNIGVLDNMSYKSTRGMFGNVISDPEKTKRWNERFDKDFVPLISQSIDVLINHSYIPKANNYKDMKTSKYFDSEYAKVQSLINAFQKVTAKKFIDTYMTFIASLDSSMQNRTEMLNVRKCKSFIDYFAPVFDIFIWAKPFMRLYDRLEQLNSWSKFLRVLYSKRGNAGFYRKMLRTLQYYADVPTADDIINCLTRNKLIGEGILSTVRNTIKTKSMDDAVSKIVEPNFKYDETSSTCNKNKLLVKGRFVYWSEILKKYSNFNSICKPNYIEVFCFGIFYADASFQMHGYSPDFAMYVYARKWVIVGKPVFHLRGYDAPKDRDTEFVPMQTNGLAGYPGYQGGAFYGLSLDSFDGNGLTVDVSGGNGGSGQKGGAGREPGKEAYTPESYTTYHCDQFPAPEHMHYTGNKTGISTGGEDRRLTWGSILERIVGKIKYIYVIETDQDICQGEDGWNRGKGGLGGPSGYTLVESFNGKIVRNLNVIKTNTRDGAPGPCGIGASSVTKDRYEMTCVQLTGRPSTVYRGYAVLADCGHPGPNRGCDLNPHSQPEIPKKFSFNYQAVLNLFEKYRPFVLSYIDDIADPQVLLDAYYQLSYPKITNKYPLAELLHDLNETTHRFDSHTSYEALRNRIEDFFPRNESRATEEEKLISAYLHSVIRSRLNLFDSRSSKVHYVYVKQYVDLINGDIKSIRSGRYHVSKQKELAIYKRIFSNKIKHVRGVISKMLPALEQSNYVVNNKTSFLVDKYRKNRRSRDFQALEKCIFTSGFFEAMKLIGSFMKFVLIYASFLTKIVEGISVAYENPRRISTSEAQRASNDIVGGLKILDAKKLHLPRKDDVESVSASLAAVFKNDKRRLKTINNVLFYKNAKIDSLRNMFDYLCVPFRKAIDGMRRNMTKSIDDFGKRREYFSRTACEEMLGLVMEVKSKFIEITSHLSIHDDDANVAFQMRDILTTVINIFQDVFYINNQRRFVSLMRTLNKRKADKSFSKNSARIPVDDFDYRIAANLALEQHAIAGNTFRQYVFPLADLYLWEFKLPRSLISANLERMLAKTSAEIEKMSSILLGKKRSLLPTTQVNMHTAEFSTHPFYKWKNKNHQNNIAKLLRGEEVTLFADPRLEKRNAVKFRSIRLDFVTIANGPEIKKSKSILESFSVSLQHSGNSYFRCGNKYFVTTYETVKFINTVDEEFGVNEVSRKISNQKMLLSPYTVWTIKLIDDYEMGFKTLAPLEGNVDVHLTGSGQYMAVGDGVCDSRLEAYYQMEKF